MDCNMIVWYDVMMETDSRDLPAQASMTLYQDDQPGGYRHQNHTWSANGSTGSAISSK